MIARLKPYPVMKDSGFEWLGEVPSHWDVRRNGRIFEQRNETGFAELPVLEVSLRTGVRIRDFKNSDRKQVMSDRDKYKRALTGDIAYNMMRMWQGAVGVAPVDGLISPAYVVARPLPGTETHYFEKLFRTPIYMQQVDNYSRGIVKDRNRLYWEYFKAMPTCYPPTEEQDAIVRYLDYVDRRMRRLMRAKRKLITLLTEQKQAIIHRAVTLGLDPDVPLEDSGVEWLGKVPKHWLVKPIRAFCSFISYGFTNPMPVVDEGPYMLTANDIGEGELRYKTARHTTQAAFDQLLTRKSRPLAGDVLVTKDGTLGRVAIADGIPVCINQSVALLRVDSREILPEYLCIALRGPLYQERMVFDAGGTAIKHIYITRLSKMRMAYPPIDEQKRILDWLNDNLKAADKAVVVTNCEIDLLNEYRTRLIADVVTGKLDIREAAAALPDIDSLAANDEPDDTLDSNADADFYGVDGTPEEGDA